MFSENVLDKKITVLTFNESYAHLGHYEITKFSGIVKYMEKIPSHCKVGPGILTQWSEE